MTSPSVRPLTPTAAAVSHTPYPSLPSLHRRCGGAPVACCPRSHCPVPNHGPSQASASQAHTPRRRLAHALLLLSHSHSDTPSLSLHHHTTRCDAWLTRVVADSSSLPTDLLACFDCETLLPTTPSVSSSANSLVTIISFRFRATSRSQAATCASLCVASPRNVHTFTRAID